MVKRQGKAGIAAGHSGIRIPANSPVIAGVRCAEGEEKELTGGATASAGERCGPCAALGLSERNGPACGIWVGFSRAVWAGPGWGFGLAGFLSFALIFNSFSFLLKQTNSNKTKLFEFKQNLNSTTLCTQAIQINAPA